MAGKEHKDEKAAEKKEKQSPKPAKHAPKKEEHVKKPKAEARETKKPKHDAKPKHDTKPKQAKKVEEEKGKKDVKEKGKKAIEKKGEKKGKEKEEKKAKKEKSEAKKVKIKKSKEVKKLSLLVRAKKRRLFRGRFGSRSIRKVSNKKWQKWRKPRGLDIYFKKEDGLVPGTGYRTPKKIRGVHPSGYRESLVKNMQDLLAVEKEKERVAARISAKIGKRKKDEMLKKADELKIVVLNR